jgi:dihydroflavonol-4-reductase
MKKRRVLVTGATGIVGSHLVRALLNDGHEVRALVRPTSDLRSLEGLTVKQLIGDVLDPASVDSAAKGCSWLFHAAAVFSYSGMGAEEQTELAMHGTRHVVQAARRVGAARVVVTSSSVAIGSSIKPLMLDEESCFAEEFPAAYTQSKVKQEEVGFNTGAAINQDVVAVCPTLVMGGHDYRLSPSNASIVNYLNDPFRCSFLGGCNVVSAHDVARGHILAAEFGSSGQRYVLGSENLNWQELHSLISQLAGTFGPEITLNHTASYLAAAAVETMALFATRRPSVTRDEARMSARFYWYSHQRMAAFGYQPMNARKVLVEAMAWVIERGLIADSVLAKLKLAPEIIAARQRLSRTKSLGKV